MKRHARLNKIVTLVRANKARYVIICVAMLILLGGLGFAYKLTQSASRQVQQESSSTDTIPMSTPGSHNLIMSDLRSGAGNNAQAFQDTSQPQQSASSSTPNASSSYTSPKAGCNYYSDVPYNTTSKPDPSLREGLTKEVGGVNGSRKVCTNTQGTVVSSEVSFPPVDKTVYYGTYTYEQAMDDAQYACRAIYYDSTQHGDCVSSELHKRGF